MTLPARDPFSEGQRLHRAKRAAARARRDAVLIAADHRLLAAQRELAKLLFAVVRGRFEGTPETVGCAMQELKDARDILREYFDNPDGDDEDGD